uniref:Uncharacterized protein n=1 Tax=Octopus bimaculoides TaxID=37653 RepID=A0A0L8FPN2_OCTBM
MFHRVKKQTDSVTLCVVRMFGLLLLLNIILCFPCVIFIFRSIGWLKNKLKIVFTYIHTSNQPSKHSANIFFFLCLCEERFY